MTVDLKMSEYGVLFDLDIEGASDGRLSGKTFVVKDLFDVEGFVTGGGNPDWRKVQSPASATALSVQQLLDAGAHLKGKSCTDELALSLDGINAFYGIPLNPQLPDRIPGGSSSGSASAVAGGVVDFGLGSDTVGSVRVPASYCGIYGIRPTHGAIDSTGVMPLGQSFDTIGWLTRDAELLADVGHVLLPPKPIKKIQSACIARNLFDMIPVEVGQHLLWACDDVMEQVGQASTIEISEYTLDCCASIFGAVRSCEVWKNYGQWVEDQQPHVTPTVMHRLTEGKFISAEEEVMARHLKREVEKYFDELIAKFGVILLPTSFGFPPFKTSYKADLDINRTNNIRFTVLSVVAGLPQVSLPVEVIPGVRLGLSIIGARSSDLDLLELAKTIQIL